MEEVEKKAKWPIVFYTIGKMILLIWVLLIFYGVCLVRPFIGSMYSISKIPRTYFEIRVKNKKAIYKQVTTMPGDWRPLNKISKRLIGAIISSEDGKFYDHPGYDIEELQDAINEGVVKRKKKVRGASTITQQLIKNLYFKTDRSLWRKTQEMGLTLWIEDKVTKERILETYLNVIEYGDNLYGITDAAKFYFSKEPSKLNARESAFLAMLLPSPKRYAQSFRKKELTPFATKIINSILLKMQQGGYIGIQEYHQSLESRFTWEKYVIEPQGPAEEGSEVESYDLGDL